MADKTALPFYSQPAMPIAAAMVTPNCSDCSARSSTKNQDRVARPARNEPARVKPTYADVVSDSSAAQRAADHSRVLARLAPQRANSAVGQTVIRPSCQTLHSQGGIEVGRMKVSSRQLRWWDSPSPGCDRDLILSSSQ
jgi:hypothetical protein